MKDVDKDAMMLAEIERLNRKTDDGALRTPKEFAPAWNISANEARARLLVAKTHGMLRQGTVHRETLFGRLKRCDGYAIVPRTTTKNPAKKPGAPRRRS